MVTRSVLGQNIQAVATDVHTYCERIERYAAEYFTDDFVVGYGFNERKKSKKSARECLEWLKASVAELDRLLNHTRARGA